MVVRLDELEAVMASDAVSGPFMERFVEIIDRYGIRNGPAEGAFFRLLFATSFNPSQMEMLAPRLLDALEEYGKEAWSPRP